MFVSSVTISCCRQGNQQPFVVWVPYLPDCPPTSWSSNQMSDPAQQAHAPTWRGLLWLGPGVAMLGSVWQSLVTPDLGIEGSIVEPS